MNPIEIAARFAAYTWFRGQPQNELRSTTEAHVYAEEHYHRFLDVGLANRQFGRLLLDAMAARECSTPDEADAWDETDSYAADLCGVN